MPAQSNVRIVIKSDSNQARSDLGRTGGALGAVQKQVVQLGTAMAGAFAVQRIARFAGEAIKEMADFQTSIAEVATLADFTDKQIREMSDGTRKLAIQFGATTKALGRARFDVVSSGFAKVNQQQKVLTASLKLGAANATDFETSTRVLTATMAAFGRGVEDINITMDELSAAANQSKASLREIGPAIGNIAPAASAAGQDLKTVGAALDVITLSGESAQEAATKIRAVFLSLIDNKTIKRLEDFGAEVKDLETGKLKPLREILLQIRTIGPSALQEIFPERRAFLGMQRLLDQFDVFEDKLAGLGDAQIAGLTERTFSRMENTLNFQLNRLSEGWKALLTKNLEGGVEGSLTSIARLFADTFQAINTSRIEELLQTRKSLEDLLKIENLSIQGRRDFNKLLEDTNTQLNLLAKIEGADILDPEKVERAAEQIRLLTKEMEDKPIKLNIESQGLETIKIDLAAVRQIDLSKLPDTIDLAGGAPIVPMRVQAELEEFDFATIVAAEKLIADQSKKSRAKQLLEKEKFETDSLAKQKIALKKQFDAEKENLELIRNLNIDILRLTGREAEAGREQLRNQAADMAEGIKGTGDAADRARDQIDLWLDAQLTAFDLAQEMAAFTDEVLDKEAQNMLDRKERLEAFGQTALNLGGNMQTAGLQILNSFGGALASGISQVFKALGAGEKISGKKIVGGILQAVGQTAIAIGTMALLAAPLASAGIVFGGLIGNPGVLLAAGGALIAFGAGLTATGAALSGGGGGGAGGTAQGQAAAQTGDFGRGLGPGAIGDTPGTGGNITFNIQGVLKDSDLSETLQEQIMPLMEEISLRGASNIQVNE